MVFHKDIFPEHIYPTYDAATIEAFLDKIPGITDRFIYFNDDVFLNNYIHPCFFFTRKTFFPKTYRSHLYKITKKEVDRIIYDNNIHDIYDSSIYYTRELVRQYFDRNIKYRCLLHTPHVYYRDLMVPFRKLFKEELKEVFFNRFRDARKFITQELYKYFMEYATKLGDDSYNSHHFDKASLFGNITIEKYSTRVIYGKYAHRLIMYGSIDDDTKKNYKQFNIINNNKSLLVYNLNDQYTERRSMYEFTELIIKKYPKPSSFEKKEYVNLEKPVAKALLNIDNFIEDVNSNYLQSINNLKNELQKYKINIVQDYIEQKNFISGPKKEISDNEKEEIDFLNAYKGELLTKEWEWAKKISMVYIINSNNNDLLTYELKYSLRSIEKHLPWFNGTIYIISDTSDISWINKINKNIKIINYKDIIPKELQYSKFNKHLIEFYLDKIPNISEKFIYLNCNHYFRNFTHPRFFF